MTSFDENEFDAINFKPINVTPQLINNRLILTFFKLMKAVPFKDHHFAKQYIKMCKRIGNFIEF